jgi:hypothetical protein
MSGVSKDLTVHHPAEGGSTLFQTVNQYLPVYTVLHLRRQSYPDECKLKTEADKFKLCTKMCSFQNAKQCPKSRNPITLTVIYHQYNHPQLINPLKPCGIWMSSSALIISRSAFCIYGFLMSFTVNRDYLFKQH